MSQQPAPERESSPKPNPGGGPGSREALSLTIAICLGIIRDQRVRRSVIFFVLIGVMLMVFLGTSLLDRWLAKHPFVFLLYWGACLWFTFLSILMAFYDLLMVRKQAIVERRELAEKMRRDVSSAASEKKKEP